MADKLLETTLSNNTNLEILTQESFTEGRVEVGVKLNDKIVGVFAIENKGNNIECKFTEKIRHIVPGIKVVKESLNKTEPAIKLEEDI